MRAAAAALLAALAGVAGAQQQPQPPATLESPSELANPQSVMNPGSGTAPGAPADAPAPAGGGVRAPGDPRAPLPPPKVGEANALVEPMSSEPIDMNFTDADVVGILRTFGAKYGKNIIAGPGVGGKVTIHLQNIPFDEAFRTLLDQAGLVAVQKSAHVIEVIKATDMPYLVQVFSLKYRFASELKTTFDATLKGREKDNAVISVDPASNSLIVASTHDILRKIKVMVDQLDIGSPQITIKARLIEVSAEHDFNWGITWAGSTLFGKGGKVQGIKDAQNYTFDANGNPVTNQTATLFPTGGILAVSSVLDKTQVFGLINALKADSTTKTISEPMILTGNNKSAKIHVGKNLPVKTLQTTLTATTQNVQYIPEGVDLDVTPVVSPGSDVISFKIRVGVSEFIGFQSDAPITTERTAQTEISIPSGKTVVIGGLMKDSYVDNDSGVPLLKDIPLLGWLFKTKQKNKSKTELLIFITPDLLEEAQAAPQDPAEPGELPKP